MVAVAAAVDFELTSPTVMLLGSFRFGEEAEGVRFVSQSWSSRFCDSIAVDGCASAADLELTVSLWWFCDRPLTVDFPSLCSSTLCG